MKCRIVPPGLICAQTGEDKNGNPKMATPRGTTQIENLWRVQVMAKYTLPHLFSSRTIDLTLNFIDIPGTALYGSQHIC
jgi:hypothetical protein